MVTGWSSPGGDDGLAGGQVGDERAQRGGLAAGRWVGADALRQGCTGQDAQEPGWFRVLGGYGEGVQDLAARHAVSAWWRFAPWDVPSVVGVPQERTRIRADLDGGVVPAAASTLTMRPVRSPIV